MRVQDQPRAELKAIYVVYELRPPNNKPECNKLYFSQPLPVLSREHQTLSQGPFFTKTETNVLHLC